MAPLIFNPRKKTNAPEKIPMSVGDLTRDCNDAASKMSANNPHRWLLLNCALAMQQMHAHIVRLEQELESHKVVI